MAQIYGYIRTSRQLQEGAPGMAPASQELQLRRAGVPRDHIYRDVGASGSTGTQERRGWHRLNGRLAGRDTLVVVAIDRIGRRWPDTIRSICELRDLGVKIRSLAETGVGIIGMDSPIYKIMEAPDCEPAQVGSRPYFRVHLLPVRASQRRWTARQ